MPYRKSRQSLHWHPLLHGRAQPNPHLLREVSTGQLFWRLCLLSACIETSAVMSFPLFSSQGNHTELCRNCKDMYRKLNEIYSQKEKNQTMCIDIEDSVSSIYREKKMYYYYVFNVCRARDKNRNFHTIYLCFYFEQAYKLRITQFQVSHQNKKIRIKMNNLQKHLFCWKRERVVVCRPECERLRFWKQLVSPLIVM